MKLAPEPGGLTSAWSDPLAWDAEYEDTAAIPSSHRVAPSRALARLLPFGAIRAGAKVLDAGSGGGRHAMHFAKHGATVHAVDVSAAACDILRGRLRGNRQARQSVSILNEELAPNQLPDESYDYILDSYASCHMLDDDVRTEYLCSLVSQLNPGGLLYTSAIGHRDEYYEVAAAGADLVGLDPVNGISKQLDRPTDLFRLLSTVGDVRASTATCFIDHVHGVPASRHVLAALITAPPRPNT